jgi:hypothetical protein
MSNLSALQQHTTTRSLVLPQNAHKLRQELCAILRHAHDQGRLSTSPGKILSLVSVIDPPPKLVNKLRPLNLHRAAKSVVGGEKNQNRTVNVPHLERDDGAWFDFSITVRELPGGLELLAYDYEIRLPPGLGSPFLRFDYNPPGHANESRDLRCHLHPGCDDISLPAPLMSPSELVTLLIEKLRTPDVRDRRAATAFEVDWLRQSHEQACTTSVLST